jgi:hypothetical protein
MQDITSDTIFLKGNYSSSWFQSLFDWIVGLLPILGSIVGHILGILIAISIPLSLFFFIVMIYCVERLKVLRKKEAEIYDLKVEPAFEVIGADNVALSGRWNRATKLIDSTNPNDWKQAIIEADVILDDLLTKLGYHGLSVGDKLKRVEKGDMKSLDEAWEAHKVRNEIAHAGLDFKLDHHVAKHTIHMYQKVFEEFYYI